jgi:L-malate glycosyltransferase
MVRDRGGQALRIAQILSGRGVNGAAVHCLTLSQALRRRGHALTLICRPDAWIERRASDSGVAIERSTLARGSIRELRRVAELLRAGGIEVIHTHMSDAHLFGVLLKLFAGLPSVATAHSTFIQAHWRFNDAVIAVSESSARFHRRWNRVPADRLHVVRPFIDVDSVRPMEYHERCRVRIACGLDPAAPAVGFVGTVCREKGVGDLISAWPVVVRAVPEAQLVVVGGGSVRYLARLQAQIARAGAARSVRWLGLRDDAISLLAACDVLALPSWRESAGLAALEAMASAVPVVATDVGGLPEFVRDRVTGLLVRPHAVDALADALVTLLTDSTMLESYRAASRARAETLSAAQQVPRVEAVLRGVVDSRG